MPDAAPRTDTREALLDAAERLFAEHGLRSASLRSITGEAGTNLAAVNYHFGSKQGLVEAVFRRRLEPLNRERLERLADCERASGGPAVEGIARAFVAPVLGMLGDRQEGGAAFARLVGRSFSEPSEDTRRMLLSAFREVVERFVAALARALPDLPPETLFWRLHFMAGAMAHTAAFGRLAYAISHGRCDPDDTGRMIDELTAFLTAGLAAPPACPSAAADGEIGRLGRGLRHSDVTAARRGEPPEGAG